MRVAVGDKAKSANRWKEICSKYKIDPAVGIKGPEQLWQVENEDAEAVSH